MTNLLSILQIIVSIFLIIGILLQRSSAGLGIIGGSDSVDAGYHSRRGLEKWLFNGTLVLVVLFAVISFLQFLVF